MYLRHETVVDGSLWPAMNAVRVCVDLLLQFCRLELGAQENKSLTLLVPRIQQALAVCRMLDCFRVLNAVGSYSGLFQCQVQDKVSTLLGSVAFCPGGCLNSLRTSPPTGRTESQLDTLPIGSGLAWSS